MNATETRSDPLLSRAFDGVRVFLQVHVLGRREANYHGIDDGKEDQPDRVSEVEPVELIDDEDAKYSNGDRVVGPPAPQQADDEPKLDHAMSQQVNGCEMARADR